MIPTSKIEVWQGDALLHTITSDALSIRIREVLTDAIGTFEFTLPTKKNGDYLYNDINPFDMVKIWLDYDSVPATPLTIGRIYEITAPLQLQQGFIRVFAGKNQGEILERRIKTRKAWVATAASTIVAELANDLGLGTGQIETDTTSVTMTSDADTYFDLLKRLSDFWYDSGNQIKKDFCVNVDNELVWKSRPLRTAGVETLTVGGNLLSYNLLTDTNSLKNKIFVYGKKAPFNPKDPTVVGRKYPTNGDAWTWVAGWVADKGAVSSESVTVKVGTTSTKCIDSAHEAEFEYDFSETLCVEGLEGYSILEFYFQTNNTFVDHTFYVRLWAPDESNYYEIALPDNEAWNAWKLFQIALGNHNLYNATTNPEGQWVAHGTPSWETLGGIEFYAISGTGFTCYVDGLCFNFGRWRSTAENATSQTNYGVRELSIVNDDLGTDLECQHHAESLLYQKKDPVKRLDFVTYGNPNILIGDKLTITLPAENISNQYFYVTTVEHIFTDKGWQTMVLALDTINTRIPPPITDREVVRQEAVKRRFYEGPVWRRD